MNDAVSGAVCLNDAARKALVILAAGALATCVTTLLCRAAGIHNGIHPSEIALIRNLFPNLRVTDFRPEPLERAQTIAFIAAACFVSVALILLPKFDATVPPKAARVFWTLFGAAFVGYFAFGHDAVQYPPWFFGTWRSIWLPEHPVRWIVALGAAASPALLSAPRSRRNAARVLGAFGIVALLLLCARVSFLVPNIGLAHDSENHHLSAALHSVVQSSFGQIPYFDFVPQYGGYGLFARPFFHLGLDPWIALCLFIFACYVVSFACMATAVATVSRSWIAGVFAAVVAFWLCADFQFEMSYFQSIPLRAVFPSVFLMLYGFYARSGVLFAALAGALVPFALYWNPETGLVCLVATASSLAFDALVAWKANTRPRWRPLLPPMAFVACAAAVAAALFAAADLVLGRGLPEANSLTYLKLFAALGFLTLPMPILDAWVPAACVFCLFLSYPLRSGAAPEQTRVKVSFAFYCAMMFSGLFFYYQGRSYIGNLIVFTFPLACAAFTWMWHDPAFTGTKRRFIFAVPRQHVATTLFALASAGLAGSAFVHKPFLDPFSAAPSRDDLALRSFIRAASMGHRTTLIVSPQAWRLHMLSGIAPPKDIPPQSALLSRAQDERLLRAATPNSGDALLVDPRFFSVHDQAGAAFRKRLLRHIDAYWRLVRTLKLKSGELQLFAPRVFSGGKRPAPAPRVSAHAGPRDSHTNSR